MCVKGCVCGFVNGGGDEVEIGWRKWRLVRAEFAIKVAIIRHSVFQILNNRLNLDKIWHWRRMAKFTIKNRLSMPLPPP